LCRKLTSRVAMRVSPVSCYWIQPALISMRMSSKRPVPGFPSRLRKLKKEKAVEISLNGLYLCRQRPTLPHTFACSTIGPAGLNFRVRDGNGWNPRGKITDKSEPSAISRQLSVTSYCADLVANARQTCKRSQPPSPDKTES